MANTFIAPAAQARHRDRTCSDAWGPRARCRAATWPPRVATPARAIWDESTDVFAHVGLVLCGEPEYPRRADGSICIASARC